MSGNIDSFCESHSTRFSHRAISCGHRAKSGMSQQIIKQILKHKISSDRGIVEIVILTKTGHLREEYYGELSIEGGSCKSHIILCV